MDSVLLGVHEKAGELVAVVVQRSGAQLAGLSVEEGAFERERNLGNQPVGHGGSFGFCARAIMKTGPLPEVVDPKVTREGFEPPTQ